MTHAGLQFPSAVYQSSIDRLVCFVTGNDGHLYDKFWDGSRWVWEDQGTPPNGGVMGTSAVYQSSIDRLVCFVIGNDGHLYDKFWDGSQWVWEDQGLPNGAQANASIPPSAVYQSSIDRLVCFVTANVTSDINHLFDKFWDGSQWVWEDQGPLPSGAQFADASIPSPVYQSSIDRLVCFVIGNDGHLYDKFWDGSQWAWEDQGPLPGGAQFAEFGGSPSAVYQSSIDRLVCFLSGTDHLYDKFWDGSQWVWEDQGTLPNGAVPRPIPPSAVYQSSIDRLVCFLSGSDDHLYDKFWDGSHWVWEDQGPLPNGASPTWLSAVYQSSIDRLVCFVTGVDGHLYDKFWDGSQWVWEDQGTPG
jgi:hypothetical protein